MNRIIITGGAGFIGSHLILHWLERHPKDEIWNVDALTYAADPKNLARAEKNPNYHFLKADLCDRSKLREIFESVRPDGVIHLAAESHVDNSISSPENFMSTNILGTFHLLEEARKLWKAEPGKFQRPRFHHVSTDEVYGSLGPTGAFTETTPYSPRSPYSASKAGSDHIVQAYHHTYGLDAVITNCSNNFGPHQHLEKLIPTVIRTARAGKPIPVYGKGENVRDWLFVRDHCEAIDLVFHKGKAGETYNVGGDNEWKNIELVKLICDLMNEEIGEGPSGDYKNLISFVTDRLGHDFRYAIDSTKLQKDLGWKPSNSFREQLRDTVKWYLERLS